VELTAPVDDIIAEEAAAIATDEVDIPISMVEDVGILISIVDMSILFSILHRFLALQTRSRSRKLIEKSHLGAQDVLISSFLAFL